MELDLYMRPTCPFCHRVMDVVEELDAPVAVHDISADAAARETLVRVGGKQQVPCLFIDGEPLYESADIIAWLREHCA